MLMVIGLAACGPRANVQGNLVDADLLKQVKPGETTKEQVQTMLGTPSSVGTFDKNTWYYIGKETQRIAFLSPDVLQQQVIQIDFDSKGLVQDIHKYGEQDGKDVEIVSRTTPTRGQSTGILDDIWNTMLHQFLVGNGADASSRDPFYHK
ncbi:MAG TPA: outer membrane protein assembly factor BamE [Alphaproteobacteria bacterium]|nr:outer membrane protein assembly factor BamE [Alphaproteobacteria bacterium]